MMLHLPWISAEALDRVCSTGADETAQPSWLYFSIPNASVGTFKLSVYCHDANNMRNSFFSEIKKGNVLAKIRSMIPS